MDNIKDYEIFGTGQCECYGDGVTCVEITRDILTQSYYGSVSTAYRIFYPMKGAS